MLARFMSIFLIAANLTACAMFSKKNSQLPINGSFKIKMDIGASYNKEIKSFPVSGQFAENTPFVNNTTIAKGLPLFGLYNNNGFSCSIIWTTITFSDGTTMNNTNGVAKSSCLTQTPIKDSDIITAKWN